MITITLSGESLAEIQKQVDSVFGGSTDKAAKPAKADKTKPKAEEEDLTGETETDGPTADDVRKAVQAAAKAGNRDQVKDILKKHKAKNVTELKPEVYQDVIDELEML